MEFKSVRDGKEYKFDVKLTYNVDKKYYTLLCFDENGTEAAKTTFAINRYMQLSMWIYKIETYEAFQHRGLGKMMLETVEQIARQHRIRVVEGKFYPYNEYAEPMYKKNGYMIEYEDITTTVFKYIDMEKKNEPFEKLEIVEVHEPKKEEDLER